MIAILSTPIELTTEQVIDWLAYHKCDFVRVNDYELIDGDSIVNLSLTNEDMNFTFKRVNSKDTVDLSKINVFWFRRFGFFNNSKLKGNLIRTIKSEVISHLISEYSTKLETFSSLLKDKTWLSHPSKSKVKKLEILCIAKENGLIIPNTYVVNSRDSLMSSMKSGKEYITKPLDRAAKFQINDKVHNLSTLIIEKSDVEQLPELFFPSLIQEYIPKEFEIRTFYLDGKTYSMAIFSQSDEQTKVDFRNYNRKKPNRKVPYTLPKKIEDKIHNFMKQIGLQTGSIDMIKSENGDHVFLEINPVGQFGMVSKPCNYYLEEKVAIYLKNKELENENENQKERVN